MSKLKFRQAPKDLTIFNGFGSLTKNGFGSLTQNMNISKSVRQ